MDLKDTYESVKEQWGLDPNPDNPNIYQSILISETNDGVISEEVISSSIKKMEDEINSATDPKEAKELTKKLENLKVLSLRPKKELDFTLEDKWKKNFDRVDELINSLDDRAKKQLLSNVFINENPKWHPERNSLVHIKIVASRGFDTNDEDLIRTALFHDIAKFDTVSFNKQGWPTSLGHDRAGAESAKSAGENDTVVYVCNNHMKIKGWLGDTESASLNPSTKYQIFSESPGATPDEKAKGFWKLCVFSKMDNMAYDFVADRLKWENPTYEKWDEECPLKEEFKKGELMEIKNEFTKPTAPFTSQEIIKFGAKGPQIGEINKSIMGKSREEAFEVIKQILGNPGLTMENKMWVKTFEQFRRGLL
jgi:hypothetical protein